jgi:hypothetical protein
MQHPQEPQDVVDLELSGSLMRFLWASGSDIPIEFPADSKDEVTSLMIEAQLKQRATNRMCAEHLLYNSNAIPAGFTLRGIFAEGAGSSR